MPMTPASIATTIPAMTGALSVPEALGTTDAEALATLLAAVRGKLAVRLAWALVMLDAWLGGGEDFTGCMAAAGQARGLEAQMIV